MAAKQDLNKNTANNMNCSLCAKLLDIVKHKPEGETELKCDKCDDESDPVVAFCIDRAGGRYSQLVGLNTKA